MKVRPKGWFLRTFTFKDAFIVWFDTIYCPPGKLPTHGIIRHEEIHREQQRKWTWLLWHILYFFFLPLFWNPFRYKWEFEAYHKGNKLSEDQIKVILNTKTYGWLL